MAQFSYLCVDEKNQYFHGELDAANKLELSKRLAAVDLFLVWWREQDVSESILLTPEAGPPRPAPVSEEEARRIMTEEARGAAEARVPPAAPAIRRRRRSLTLERGLGAVVGVALGLWFASWWLHRPPRIPSEMLYILPKMKQLRQGMTRAQVEQIFAHKQAEHSDAGSTRYVEPGTVAVQVYYDSTGGPGSPQNRTRFYEIRTVPPPPPQPLKAGQ
jgi:hypothetical protein